MRLYAQEINEIEGTRQAYSQNIRKLILYMKNKRRCS